MIHFKDTKNKSALSTRWAQMSKQEQIIEKKKMEIQAKLEAQKNVAALAAQAKLSNPGPSEDSKNIFSNDGSFMSQYKALLEKQNKEKQEKEKKEKQERQEKNEELQRKKNEAKQKSESSQEVDYDSDQNYSNDRRDHDHHEGRHRERNRRWSDRSRNRAHSPFTPTVEDRKSAHDTNHIPSLMQISVKPPSDRSQSRWNRDDSDSNDDYDQKPKQEYDSDSGNAIQSPPSGPDFMNSGPMGPRPMAPGIIGPGPMGGHVPMGTGPMGYGSMGPGPMGPGQMGHMPMGPRPMGPGRMGPGPMGPGPMGAGPMGPGPMGHGPMGPGPMGPGQMGTGPMGPGQMGTGPMGPGPIRPGSMGQGPMGHSSSMMPPGTSNANSGPRPNVSAGNSNVSQNMGPNNSNMPGNSNMPQNMGPGNPNMPQNMMGPGNPNMPQNMGPGNQNRPQNMGPGNSNMPQNMGPGNSNMPQNMGPGNSNMPPMPFMGGPPNFQMPPNFMGPNGPRGPCGPMPPNMCGPNFRGPGPNGPMPPFFPPNGPPNSMMPPNMSNDQRFMGPQPPFGPNGPNFGPNRPNFGPNGPNFGPNNMGNMPFMPPSSMSLPPPGNEQKLDSMKLPPMMPNEHDNKKVLSADTFQSIHRAASEVASNGDHWESVLKAMNSQDQSLWFLHNTNSNEYKMYRDLVSKIRNEKQIKKEEIKPEDKYEPEFSLEDDESNDEPSKDNSSSNYQSQYSGVKREASSQSDEEADTKRERRKRKSRWGDDPPVDVKPPGMIAIPPPPLPGVQLAKIDEDGIKLSTLNRSNQALMQYALTNYGTTNLSAEDWQKCEDNFKLNLLFQDMLKKRQEVERLAAAGKHKYEYDSDEDTAEGTWEHKLRSKEMNATEKWADELTKQAAGKHHIGDFLPPEELKKFMEKYSAVKSGKEPDLSDYKEYKLREDNVGFKMLQKLGWNEGQGLGAEGTGIVEPINKANQPVANMGLGAKTSDVVSSEDDEFDAYRKRMMLAYRFRPNPLNNPRRPYY